MNVNNIELYNNFQDLLKINNLIIDFKEVAIKEFTLNNSVNELIMSYEKLTEYSEILCNNKDEKKLFCKLYYENVCDYIMKNNFQSIKKIENIYILFSYVNPKKIYELIIYLNPLLSNKNSFNKLLLILYTIMINKSNKNENIIDYYELIDNLYKENIIKNPLYEEEKDEEDEEDEEEENKIYISLFDFFVHASYIYENSEISLFFLKLILNQLKSLNNEDLVHFYSIQVNMNNLDILYNVCEKNISYLNMIEKRYKKNNIYTNTFSYFVAKLLIHMKKYNLVSKYVINNESIIDLVNYYYDNILYSEERKSNNYLKININFDPSESVEILSDLFKINNVNNYMIFIDSYNKSNDLTPVGKVFILIGWFRFIYFKINKNNDLIVTYNSETNKYYLKKSKNSLIELDYDEFMNDILSYMNQIYESNNNIYEFLVENMKQFVYNDYDIMKEKCIDCKDKNCSICLDEVNNNNMNICYFCNKIFHDSCINELWKMGHDNCPLCRKAINSSFYTYSHMRYDLLKNILERL